MAHLKFAFSIPALPKPWYEWVKDLGEEYGVSQYDVVMGGLRALGKLQKSDLVEFRRVLGLPDAM